MIRSSPRLLVFSQWVYIITGSPSRWRVFLRSYTGDHRMWYLYHSGGGEDIVSLKDYIFDSPPPIKKEFIETKNMSTRKKSQ